MRAIVRPVWFATTAMGVLAMTLTTHAQAPAAKGTTPATSPPAAIETAPAPTPATRVSPAKLTEVIATVNGENITRGDLLDFLSRYEIPPENEEQIYSDAVETLVNMKLVGQFLTRQNIKVSEDRVTEAVNQLEKQLKADGSSLAQALVESNKSMKEVRDEYANRLRWIDYVKLRGTDAELKKYAEGHKDLLSGTQIRASHILKRVEPTTTAAEKEQIKQKLISLKKDIESKKTTFAEAANKNSEDPANSENGGGDIGFFGLNSGIVEEFSQAAFALKPGQLSDPVETPYGFHLILVTDRQEKPKVDYEQNKPLILNVYASELQKDLLVSQRKTAKIDIKPMPKDLFIKAPAPTTAPVPAGATKKAAGAPATPKTAK
ncbi:peptidylprolyl isomerase [Singulisphaera sp. Ch08]|uniref:Peptidylprolyl isomerase n=1 Tax=Singulisphaera sp. Ch08 TaxID=3120278 RepID=A0AAU7CHJ8_9BACT